MAVNKGEIGIYGVLRRDGGDNILARTDQVQDAKANKTQEQLNQEALNKAAIAAAHIANTENPHSVNKSQVGLGNVSNDAQVKRSEMGKPLGVATLDGLGKVPLAQLGNIDTQVMLVVDKLPNTDIKANKIYLVRNTDSTEDQNVYTEYVYVNQKWEKVGEFKPEVDLSSIMYELKDLKAHSFYLGDNGGIASPFNFEIFMFARKIQEFKNNEEYAYADITENLDNTNLYIYDKSLYKTIKITGTTYTEIDTGGNFFRTAEPLDLSHTFYLDNEKTSNIENLDELTIEESDVFKNLPYKGTSDKIYDDEAPQYIYDATDRKWIEVVETWYISAYYSFNTEEPLDLTHEFCYCNNPTVWNYSQATGEYSIALGHNVLADNSYAIALGQDTKATGESSIALGYGANVIGMDAVALGSGAKAYGNESVALGYNATATGIYSIALGNGAKTSDDNTIVIGKNNYSSTSACYSLSSEGKPLMEIERNNKGLYLQGFGGYDGTNLVVKSGNTETLNPNIKSVQQIINEKADASAIPTKVSQLTNDSNFITLNSNPTLSGLTVNNNAKIKYIQKTGGDEGTYLIAETPADRVANKVYAADGSLFDASKLVKKVQCNVSGDPNNIEFGYTTVDGTYNFSVVPTVTTDHSGIMSPADKSKLDAIEAGAQVNTVTGVKGDSESSYRTGNVSISASNIGLGNVNNTSDADKPISTAQQAALDEKVDKVSGKGLSTNDYTTDEKNKLAGIAAGAQVNVIESVKVNGTAQTISNKEIDIPVPTKLSQLTNDIYEVATSAEITAILN